MEAVILAGGRGERLGKLTKNVPKPLIMVGNRPVIEHQILMLKKYGIKKIWVLSGYLGEKIEGYLGNGKRFGMKIKYLKEAQPLGTAGALKQLEGKTRGNLFVISGDLMFDIEIGRLFKFHNKHKGAIATIVVHPSDHPFDSDLVEIDQKGFVRAFIIRNSKNKRHSKKLLFKNITNAGLFVASEEIFKYIQKNIKVDLEKDIFPKILKSKRALYAYKTSEYIKDMGSLDRLKKVSNDHASGKIRKLNLKKKRGAIFLDRDGTINKPGGVQGVGPSNFQLLPFASKAIKKINEFGYLAIIISNQAAVAKGFLTFDEVDKVHKKLETELGFLGAKIDGIYFCPHYPEKGFENEVDSLKINCSCRKPKIGLIKRAVSDFNIDIKRSYFIGDTTIDAKTAEKAGIKFIGVKTGHSLKDNQYKIEGDITIVKNILGATDLIARLKYF